MADLDFLKTNPKTRTTASRTIAALAHAGFDTLEKCLAAGYDKVKRPYVTETTWAAIRERSIVLGLLLEDGSHPGPFLPNDQPEPLVYDAAMDHQVDATAYALAHPVWEAHRLVVANGPNSDAAVAAVEALLEDQYEHGFCRTGLEPDGSPDWAPVMASLLLLYRDAKPPSVLYARLGEWWNQAVQMGLDPDVTLWINTGKKVEDPSPAARIFYSMSELPDIPLPRPARPYPVAG